MSVAQSPAPPAPPGAIIINNVPDADWNYLAPEGGLPPAGPVRLRYLRKIAALLHPLRPTGANHEIHAARRLNTALHSFVAATLDQDRLATLLHSTATAPDAPNSAAARRADRAVHRQLAYAGFPRTARSGTMPLEQPDQAILHHHPPAPCADHPSLDFAAEVATCIAYIRAVLDPQMDALLDSDGTGAAVPIEPLLATATRRRFPSPVAELLARCDLMPSRIWLLVLHRLSSEIVATLPAMPPAVERRRHTHTRHCPPFSMTALRGIWIPGANDWLPAQIEFTPPRRRSTRAKIFALSASGFLARHRPNPAPLLANWRQMNAALADEDASAADRIELYAQLTLLEAALSLDPLGLPIGPLQCTFHQAAVGAPPSELALSRGASAHPYA